MSARVCAQATLALTLSACADLVGADLEVAALPGPGPQSRHPARPRPVQRRMPTPWQHYRVKTRKADRRRTGTREPSRRRGQDFAWNALTTHYVSGRVFP
jgi:hypothetical protein